MPLSNLGDHRAAPFGKDGKPAKAAKNTKGDDEKASLAERQAAGRRSAENLGEDVARKNAADASSTPEARAVGRDVRAAGRASDRREASGFESFNRSNAGRKLDSYAAELGQALSQHASEPI